MMRTSSPPELRTVRRNEEQLKADRRTPYRGGSASKSTTPKTQIEDVEMDLIALTFQRKELLTGQPQLDLPFGEILAMFDDTAEALKDRLQRGKEFKYADTGY